MESEINLLEPLLERIETYGKTNLELMKLKSLDKTADVFSSLSSRLLFGAVMSLFVLTFNIAVALWLGDLCGKNYYGFLIVALVYALAGLILYYRHAAIKARMCDLIITKMLN